MSRQLSTQRGPSTVPATYRLVTVNPKPERAAHVASLVATRLQDRFTIQHIGNIESEDKVATTVVELKPDILFCASLWTSDESTRIINTAIAALPGLLTHAVPYGLHNTGGPDAVVTHLADSIGSLINNKDKI
ncbi:hypothetical protein F503_01387 [Ophiostoma piceae UAMH 11346]|uniref:Uncharacterized protein n=1 Tax=Ophiostoma piceae (strain UAMH 11346) TaxID=1262450 RepID=S3CDJ4_OPHP1|nr:hypothetical protein F503_01387 [Ophiostoma piceae UAMH 11346]